MSLTVVSTLKTRIRSAYHILCYIQSRYIHVAPMFIKIFRTSL